MKPYKFSGLFFIIVFFTMLFACEDENSNIGGVISPGEVEITVDTFYFDLKADPLYQTSFDSKTGNLMFGNIQLKEYGTLNCSFVTRLMCAAKLGIPDSLFFADRVDSCFLIMAVERKEIFGDSLAPQKLSVYPLTQQIPSDIANNFNPTGYYDPSSPLATKSYTVSEIANVDSNFYNRDYIELSVNLPVEFGKSVFEAYKNNPDYFQWPQTMAEKFLPGIYVETSFGKGCVANVTNLYFGIFFHSFKESTSVIDGDTTVTVTPEPRVVYPFTVTPEVVSSNNITYNPSANIVEKNEAEDGEVVITTPGGYIADFVFPVQTLIDRYNEKNIHLSTVNELMLYLPGEPFEPSTGIPVTTNLLMVKKSEYEEFFQKNKIPDGTSSFLGTYDDKNNRYNFTSLRGYFLDLIKKETITDEDIEFVFVPVEIETETSNNYYGSGSTYITKCVPFTTKPTMTLLKTGEAMVTFSFSTQIID